jgi:hypothetical protein
MNVNAAIFQKPLKIEVFNDPIEPIGDFIARSEFQKRQPIMTLQLTPSRHASLFTTVFTSFATPIRTSTRARGS